MDETGDLFFEKRFLEAYAGTIMSDPTVAIVELVANAWDAYATDVKVEWPDAENGRQFSVTDNGKGMTYEDFAFIWRAMSYDRIARFGTTVQPPDDLDALPREVFGRNGKGRFASFCFSSDYQVTSWKDGKQFSCVVRRSITKPFRLEDPVFSDISDQSHGTRIEGLGEIAQIGLDAARARDIIGSRFLANPAFKVFLGGRLITFADVSARSLSVETFEIPDIGSVTIRHIDTIKADRSTKQHGIAWWVQDRAVGDCAWHGSDLERILDGRTSEAKRYTFIVSADFLNKGEAVKEDWSGFHEGNAVWKQTQAAVQQRIREIIDQTNTVARERKRSGVFDRVGAQVNALSPLGRDRVRDFINDVVDRCPHFGESEIVQLTTILATLENSKSLYGLLNLLHTQTADEMDDLHEVLRKWTVGMVKIVMDEIQTRLYLIRQLKAKLLVKGVDEVHELQPIFAQGLWMFGAQFESIEFTSNRGMTEVIRAVFGDKKGRGSLNRPDFVALPDESVGLYARSSYNNDHDEDGIEHLVIIDLKTTGLPMGSKEKDQVWKYIKELRTRGYLRPTTRVDGFILGDRIEEGEEEKLTRGETVTIVPVLYDTIVRRAEKRMLNLYAKVEHAPFLNEDDAELKQFREPIPVIQNQLLTTATEND
jgi:hypothetical protein